jgi:hypothetical protein
MASSGAENSVSSWRKYIINSSSNTEGESAQPLAHYNIQITNWQELQREKGESAHDAWKVGEESDSKPSAIDHVELKH